MANRLASSTMTTRAPLPTIRSSNAAKRPPLDRIFAADRLVAKLVNDLEAGAVSEGRDGMALTLLLSLS